MQKSLVVGLVAALVAGTAGAAIAGYSLRDRGLEYARVVEVTPVEKTILTPQRICHDQSKQQCETVYGKHIERLGYDVRYRVGDQERKIRMDHDPGDRIPMRSGQLVLDESTGRGTG
jgi:uncharacterized protein YcfJ